MALVGVYICAFGSAGLSGRPGVASAQRGPGDAGVRPFTRRFRAFGARVRKRVSGAFGASAALPGGWLCSHGPFGVRGYATAIVSPAHQPPIRYRNFLETIKEHGQILRYMPCLVPRTEVCQPGFYVHIEFCSNIQVQVRTMPPWIGESAGLPSIIARAILPCSSSKRLSNSSLNPNPWMPVETI